MLKLLIILYYKKINFFTLSVFTESCIYDYFFNTDAFEQNFLFIKTSIINSRFFKILGLF